MTVHLDRVRQFLTERYSPEQVARAGSEVRHRCTETGVDVENFDERLRCCQLHIALDSMAYKAFRRDGMNLNGTIDRLLPLLDAPIEKDRTV